MKRLGRRPSEVTLLRLRRGVKGSLAVLVWLVAYVVVPLVVALIELRGR